MKNQKGITLISIVITIVVLIILAGVAINMTLGENGIFTKAQEAKKAQTIAEAKEQIGLEILAAQIEAAENNKELEQSKIEEIVSKYGELQEDGDTIILSDSGYEVSLTEIYNETKNSETTLATEDKILKGYSAYKDGKLLTGTMANYAGITQDATVTSDDTYTYLSIPNNGYYTAESKLRVEKDNLDERIYIIKNGVLQSDFTLTEQVGITFTANGYATFNGTGSSPAYIDFSKDLVNYSYLIADYLGAGPSIRLYIDGTFTGSLQGSRIDLTSYTSTKTVRWWTNGVLDLYNLYLIK